jgi:GNAT superfamily N-acetyltransferase
VIEVCTFTLEQASERDRAEYHQMFAATYVADRPLEPVPTYEAAIGYLRTPLYGSARNLHWAAHVDGRLDGLAKVGLPGAENAHLAFVFIRVHPGSRRLGVGKALLGEAARAIHAEGRPLVTAWGITAESEAEAWARKLNAKAVRGTARGGGNRGRFP